MGRPRQFDEQHLLHVAEELFWVNGYERTSIEQVAANSGVTNGSLYGSYGSKLGLFLAVFNRYCDAKVVIVRDAIGQTGPLEDAVANYLDRIVVDCTSYADRRGCLMLNSIGELASRFPEVAEIATRAVTRMEEAVADRIAEGVAAGEIHLAPEKVRDLGAHVVLVSQGLIQLSRVGTPSSRLHAIAETSRSLAALRRAD
jgi:AcrR family transcriptional regulator